jgi:hypothetical protein
MDLGVRHHIWTDREDRLDVVHVEVYREGRTTSLKQSDSFRLVEFPMDHYTPDGAIHIVGLSPLRHDDFIAPLCFKFRAEY